MKILSKVPGRIRVKEKKIYRNQDRSEVLDIYLRNLPGVRESKVNSINGTITIYYDPEVLSLYDLEERIEHVLESDSPYLQYIHESYRELLAEERKLSLAQEKMLIFGGLYLVLKIKHLFFGKFSPGRSLSVLTAAALITIFNGYPFFQRLTKKLGEYFPSNPDKFLLGVGVLFTILREGDGILFLFLKSFTDAVEANSQLEMKKVLLDNSPNPMDLVWYKEGADEYLVPFKSLKVGDHVLFGQNDTVLVHGTITEGETMVNCLYFTGQPEYRQLQKGDQVKEGMVLTQGKITVQISELPTRVPKADLILDDLEIVQKVKGYQEKAIYIASGLALLGFAITGSLITSVGVFLVMNPAATQVALTAGVTSYLKLLLKNKIILRNVNTLEKIMNTRKVVFDKTGTLTDGRLHIIRVDSLDATYSSEEILRLGTVCQAQRFSPIQEDDESLIFLPADGVCQRGTDESIYMGDEAALGQMGIEFPDELRDEAEEPGLNLYVIQGKRPIGRIHLVEEVDETVALGIQQLGDLGVEDVVIVSGDNKVNVQKIADQLGIVEVYSECNKGEKAHYIKGEVGDGAVIMVGDGVNDADAMEAADLSISFNQANSQVVSSSDCILLEKDMALIPKLLELTAESYYTIEKNINFSWYYNLFFGSITSLGYLTLFQAEAVKTFNLINSVLNSGNISKLDPPALREIFGPVPSVKMDVWDQEKEKSFFAKVSENNLKPVTI